MKKEGSVNQALADRLREAADLLEQQGANPFRVGAYRKAGAELAALPRGADEILHAEGPEGLIALPSIGRGIAAAIVEIVDTGRWGQLERLRGTLDPGKLFQAVPGVGPDLAERIHGHLHVDTLEALEAARPGWPPRRGAGHRPPAGGLHPRLPGNDARTGAAPPSRER